MLVKDLIKELEKLDKDCEIKYLNTSGTLYSIEKITKFIHNSGNYLKNYYYIH